jgi:hypothetical protein
MTQLCKYWSSDSMVISKIVGGVVDPFDLRRALLSSEPGRDLCKAMKCPGLAIDGITKAAQATSFKLGFCALSPTKT